MRPEVGGGENVDFLEKCSPRKKKGRGEITSMQSDFARKVLAVWQQDFENFIMLLENVNAVTMKCFGWS